ncbi:late competence development ComFB family protein [Eisenbergiella tayi]|nr:MULTISPECIES: late competence development ComFB family protein [Clostridia]
MKFASTVSSDKCKKDIATLALNRLTPLYGNRRQ